MSLYLKHRPDNFDDVFGNKDEIKSLKSLLEDREKTPHAFLFTGETGCGKTTLGRILAKELGAVGSGKREIDSGDFRGIDTIREIRHQSRFLPMEGKVSVWIMDECHQLVNTAQSALLKLLEDTPKHVYIILCTTDPQKLLPTIRGRCSTYKVEPLTDMLMERLLKNVLSKENESLDEKVMDQIITDSLGFPRNALVTLEKVLSVSPKRRMKVALKSAEETSQIILLCRALLGKKPWKEIADILLGLQKIKQDAEGIRRAVLGYAQAVLLKADNPLAGNILANFEEPTYNIGFPGITLACYRVYTDE